MPENENEKRGTRIIKAKKIPPPEPFGIRKTEPLREVKKVLPPEPTRKTKPNEVKKGEG